MKTLIFADIMNYTDLLTIAIPCYERKEFFLEALESALNQTVKCKIIVVDNCSSHDYFKKVCFSKKIPYHRNDYNIGIAANFAKAYELSETKYVSILQDDDILSSLYVETFVNTIIQFPNIDIFFTDFAVRTVKGVFPRKLILPFGYMENGTKIIEYGALFKLGFPYMTSAIRKEIAYTIPDTVGWKGGYDWEWIYSVADKLIFYGNDTVLYYVREHDKQITFNNKTEFTLARSYLYEKILLDKVSENKQRKLILKYSFWELVLLKSQTERKRLKKLLIGNDKYEKYLRERLNKDFKMKMIYSLPKGIVYFLYKSLRKIGFIQ